MDRAQQKIVLNKKIEDSSETLKKSVQTYKDLGKDALLIGGVLVLGYSLFQLFSDDAKEEDDSKESLIGTGLKGLATSVLLTIAKQKLTEYFESLEKNDD